VRRRKRHIVTAKQRSAEGEAKVKQVNSRIGYTSLLIFVCIAVARAVQFVSKPAALAVIAVGACIWIYVMTLVFSKRHIH
jgi:uncharacterized membrane protein